MPIARMSIVPCLAYETDLEVFFKGHNATHAFPVDGHALPSTLSSEILDHTYEPVARGIVILNYAPGCDSSSLEKS